jgi:NAD-dependent dihydropyrimidine dehydrogenase PreA subunit
MIELISNERCTGCDICVRVCPTNVFDSRPRSAPVIARQEDCQTCFQCEAHCPEHALFVAPLRVRAPEGSVFRDEAALRETGQLGIYRTRIGWNDEDVPAVPSDDDFSALMQEVRARLP